MLFAQHLCRQTKPAVASSLSKFVSRRNVTTFKAPVQDVHFILDHVLDAYRHFPSSISKEDVKLVIGEIARFTKNEVHPGFQIGDRGCKFDGENVQTPPGWKAAYQKYVEGGWPALAAPIEHGGQGFPGMIDIIKEEFCCTANTPWAFYTILGHGAVKCVMKYGNELLKKRFLPKMVSGEWTGTMCLTEPQSGSDLGLVRTKAVPSSSEPGIFLLSGTKCFITGGENDFMPNIMHLVLARLPDAPAGTKGISLFLVPKYFVKEDGTFETKKNVVCGGIEHKMGIHGSATCVLNFDEARGFLVGKPHNGMKEMFSMMNSARIGIGMQGIGAAELAYQLAVPYARLRVAGKAPNSKGTGSDPIIKHADVRRMLLKIRTFAEGGRCLAYHTALLEDRVHVAHNDALEAELGLLTPIVKAMCTELGFEAANEGLQVFGGHGYIAENGIEQLVRDTRPSTIYEGTTYIQAMDLLGRKVMLDKSVALKAFCDCISSFCKETASKFKSSPALCERANKLDKLSQQWLEVTRDVVARSKQDPVLASSIAVDYLYGFGYIVYAYMWLRMETTALTLQSTGCKEFETNFISGKVFSSTFFFDRILPRVDSHIVATQSSSKVFTEMTDDMF